MIPNQKKIWDKIYSQEKNKWKKESVSVPSYIKGKTVLELGVGNGKNLISILKRKPKRVTAIDFSKEAARQCNERFKNIENLDLRIGDARHLEFKHTSFDIVFCHYLLNNLQKNDRKSVVAEIFRVLNKKGILLFEDFGQGDFRESDEEKEIEEHTLLKNNSIICHFFSEEELRNLFADFSHINLYIKTLKPIKTRSDLVRKIISGEIKK